MKNKTTNTCEKITNCLFWFYNSPYCGGQVARISCEISLKTAKELEEDRKKEEEQIQQEKERLLPWGSV